MAAAEEGSDRYRDGSTIKVLTMVGTVRIQNTKTGAKMAYAQLEDLYGAIEAVVFPKTLAQYEERFEAGQVILVTGRLDIQDDKEPKLLVERVEPVPDTPPEMPAEEPQKRVATPPKAENAPPKASNPKAGLYLRLPTEGGKEFESAYHAVTTAPGAFPVYIRFVDSGRMVKTPKEWWVTPTAPLLQELKRVLGEENVAVVK